MPRALAAAAASLLWCAAAAASSPFIGASDPYEPDLSTPESAVRSSLESARRREPAAYLKTQAEWVRRRYGSDPVSQIEGVRREWAKHGFPEFAEIEITGVEYGEYPDYDALVFYDEIRTYPDGRKFRKSVRAAAALEDRLWRVKYAFVEDPAPRAPGTAPYSGSKSVKDAESIRLFR